MEMSKRDTQHTINRILSQVKTIQISTQFHSVEPALLGTLRGCAGNTGKDALLPIHASYSLYPLIEPLSHYSLKEDICSGLI